VGRGLIPYRTDTTPLVHTGLLVLSLLLECLICPYTDCRRQLDWLSVAIRLRPVSDAGASEQLDLSVGEA
jgi:hypothetical protein